MHKLNYLSIPVLASCLFACNVSATGEGTGAVAQTQSSLSAADSDTGSARRPSPPKEAFEACSALAEGAACTVKFGERSMNGSCRKGPDGSSALACAPSGRPPHPKRGGPPPEALTACTGLAENATCSMTLGDKTVSGSCRRGPQADAGLACAPSGPPPHEHHGGPPQEAFAACNGLAEGTACSVKLEDRILTGSCRKGPDGNPALACVLPPPEFGE